MLEENNHRWAARSGLRGKTGRYAGAGCEPVRQIRIYVESTGAKRVNAKSIMGMMTLGLIAGQSITVEADGADEDQAVSEI